MSATQIQIDPEVTYPKKVNLLVTTGPDDTRTMEEFISDLKVAAASISAKHATVLGARYLVDGTDVSMHDYNEATHKESDEAADEA